MFWPAIVTQAKPGLLKLPMEQQPHESLESLSAEFRGAE